eukprot:3724550-Lingulodinium_polyedra.AAC.1
MVGMKTWVKPAKKGGTTGPVRIVARITLGPTAVIEHELIVVAVADKGRGLVVRVVVPSVAVHPGRLACAVR